MVTIDSDVAMARALSDVGRSYTPQGYCLEHNARWQLNGITSNFGRNGKYAQIALDGWNWTDPADRIAYDGRALLPEAWNGLPFYFGVSPTRTDRNKAAGDITTVYHGKLICTDASGSRVGVMSVAERAAEIKRPALGVTPAFLGTPTTAGLALISPAEALKAIGAYDMFKFSHADRGEALGGAGFFHPLTAEESPYSDAFVSTKIACSNARQFDLIKDMCLNGTSTPSTDSAAIAKAVWDADIDNPAKGGKIPARNRLGGLDQFKENVATMNPDVVQGLVKDIVAALPTNSGGTIKVPTAEEIVDLLAQRLAN